MARSEPGTFGIVGSGWRAQFFPRLARLLPEKLTLVGGVVRRPDNLGPVSSSWGVPVYLTPEELVTRHQPSFVITSVPRTVNPSLIKRLVDLDTPVLSETPPAPDVDGLRQLWADVGDRAMVQVAEQYLLMPLHAARLELVRQGVIGKPTAIHISSTHDYHAVSMMRAFLGAGYAHATVTAKRVSAPLVNPLKRDGWTDDEAPHEAENLLAVVDFGEAGSALYDFTDNQWHNQLRFRRLLIRGTHGEIENTQIVRLIAPRTIVRSELTRSQLGYDLNLDGYDTEHLAFDGHVVWRNEFLGLRLMDEEIAVA